MNRWLLLPMLLIPLLCGSAFAMTVIVPLNELVGPVTFMPATAGQETAFDSHQQFSSIESVTIEIEARLNARQFDVCGTTFDPQPCVHEVQLLGFFALMDKEDSPVPGFIFSDGLAFSEDFRALEGYGVDNAIFNNRRIGWDFLLDGRGSLTLLWNLVLGDPDRIILNYQDPSGEILSARLIIEGTPIPEPSSALSIGIGLFALSLCRNSCNAGHKRQIGYSLNVLN